MTDVEKEYRILTSLEGQSFLSELAEVAAIDPARVARWRRSLDADLVSAALRLAEARRKARGKFAKAEEMWLTPTGAEQATGELVARHKAIRFAEKGALGVVDLCCGIGGDSLAIASTGLRVLAVDQDQGMGRRVLWNSKIHAVWENVAAVCCRAERFPIPRGFLVHIDPDRRSGGGRRAKNLAEYAPDIHVLRALIATSQGGAIKLGPASDFGQLAASGGVEIELISLDGECKEATLWYGDLAGIASRRATHLPSGSTWNGEPSRSDVCEVAALAGRWCYDPDPALIRSGLLEGFAAQHDLARIDHDIDYLTAEHRVESPFLQAFEVEAVLPMDRKRIREYCRAHRVCPVVVKSRGVRLSPEAVRRWVKGDPGDRGVTLMLSGSRDGHRAIIATRFEST